MRIGRSGASFAEPVADLNAINLGQHDIEQDQVKFGIHAALGRREAIGDHIHHVACPLEQIHQAVPQQRVIFNDEDFHGVANRV